MEQLSLRQELISQVLSSENEDGKFDYLIGELERIANKIPYAKKEEYYKLEARCSGKRGTQAANKAVHDFIYFQDDWNTKKD